MGYEGEMGMKSHQTIESMIEEGIVSGDLAAKAEIFILIDNSVGKAAFILQRELNQWSSIQSSTQIVVVGHAG